MISIAAESRRSPRRSGTERTIQPNKGLGELLINNARLPSHRHVRPHEHEQECQDGIGGDRHDVRKALLMCPAFGALGPPGRFGTGRGIHLDVRCGTIPTREACQEMISHQ